MSPSLIPGFIIYRLLPYTSTVRYTPPAGEVTERSLVSHDGSDHVGPTKTGHLLLPRRGTLAQPRIEVPEAHTKLLVRADHVRDPPPELFPAREAAHELEVGRYPRPALGELVALQVGGRRTTGEGGAGAGVECHLAPGTPCRGYGGLVAATTADARFSIFFRSGFYCRDGFLLRLCLLIIIVVIIVVVIVP